jgi:hypothetical protein
LSSTLRVSELSADNEVALELALWDSVKDGSPAELESYLEQYPEGTFASLARTRRDAIVTFLMVFVIQNTQSRDTQAMQLKLDELIRVNEMARNSLINLEEMSDIGTPPPVGRHARAQSA